MGEPTPNLHPHPSPTPPARAASHALRWTLPAGLLLAGCSLPLGGGRQVTFGYAATHPAGGQIRTAVAGLDVRLGTRHDGINLGWSSVAEASASAEPAPTNSAAAAEGPWRYLPPLGWAREGPAGTRRLGWFVWQRPPAGTHACQFVAEGHAGLALGFNRQLGGLELGFGRQTWLRVPLTNGAGTLSFRSGIHGPVELREGTTNPIKPE